MSPATSTNVGACVDPTLSIAPGFATAARSLLANVVATWAAPVPPSTVTTALPPHPGLHLVIREVGTYSNATNVFFRVVDVVPVNGLKAQPKPDDPNFAEDDKAWAAARETVVSQATRAASESRNGGASIGAMPLIGGQNVLSEIDGCVTALGATLPAGPKAIVLWSDLQQNQPPQSSRDLADANVLAVQACETGHVAECAGLANAWRQHLMLQGAASTQFIRPEVAASTVPTFIRGGSQP